MKQRGFTLIELMVVILIIAILGALGMVSYSQANKSARDGKRKADMEAVRQALLLSKQENTNSCFPAASNTTPSAAQYNNLATPLTNYLSTLPKDPQSANTNYKYARSTLANSGTNGCPYKVALQYIDETGATITNQIP